VIIINSGAKGAISIGLTSKKSLEIQPGTEEGTYSYLGPEGKKFHNSYRGENYGEQFTTGDIIGCGVHYNRQEIFFTKNGKHLGVAFKKVKREEFFPVVSLHSLDESISANFGLKPFKFDLEGMISELKEKMMVEVKSLPIHVGDVNSIIRNYFLYYGYEETLKSFESAFGTSSEVETIASLQKRKKNTY